MKYAVNKGFGMPELLISLFLSSFIIISLVNHYLSIKKNYKKIEQRLEDKTNMQLLMDMMQDSIRRAGFTPCLSLSHLMTRNAKGQTIKPLTMTSTPYPLMTIRRMDEPFTTGHILDKSRIQTKNHLYHSGQIILVADCHHAETATIKQIQSTASGQEMRLFNPLIFSYQSTVYIGGWLEERYMIKHNQKVASLYYGDNRQDKLSGVVNNMTMAIHLGQKRTLVEIILSDNHDATIQFDTAIRAQ